MATATMEKRRGGEVAAPERMKGGRIYSPAVDIVEKEDELLLFADVPGARPQGIDVNFENGELTISARVEPRQPQDNQYLLREYGVGDYYRVFRIGDTIDSTRIHAEVKNGVLIVHLPKSEDAKPRKIAVKAS